MAPISNSSLSSYSKDNLQPNQAFCVFQTQTLVDHQFSYLPYKDLSSCQRVCRLFQLTLSQILKTDHGKLKTAGYACSLGTLARTGIRSPKEFIQLGKKELASNKINEMLVLSYVSPHDGATGLLLIDSAVVERNKATVIERIIYVNAIFPRPISHRFQVGNYSISVVRSTNEKTQQIIHLVEDRQVGFYLTSSHIAPPLLLSHSSDSKTAEHYQTVRNYLVDLEEKTEVISELLEIVVQQKWFIIDADDAIGIQITETLSRLISFYKKIKSPNKFSKNISIEIEILKEMSKALDLYKKLKPHLPNKKNFISLINCRYIKAQIFQLSFNIAHLLNLNPKNEESGEIRHFLVPTSWKLITEILVNIQAVFKQDPRQFPEDQGFIQKFSEEFEVLKTGEEDELFKLTSLLQDGFNHSIASRTERLKADLEEEFDHPIVAPIPAPAEAVQTEKKHLFAVFVAGIAMAYSICSYLNIRIRFGDD